MKIGFDMLLWTSHVLPSHRPHFEALKAAGYDGIEIPMFEGDPDHYAQIGRILDELELPRTAITVVGSPDANPIGEGTQDGAVKYLTWAIECAQALGADILAGPLHSTLGQFSGEPRTQEEWKRGIETHRRVGDIAEKHGVTLALEALNRFECYFLNTMEDLAAYCDAVNHPRIRAMYDTFHANIEEKDPKGAARGAIRHVVHVHISENDRGTPGRGHIDMKGEIQNLKAAGYDGWLTIEAFGRALPALAAATRVWRDFFPAPEQVYLEGLQTIRNGWKG